MSSGARRTRSTTRDIKRYAALFAERTKVMKSSAMRDLMALTEQPDVISLAGGLPDTSTFPPDSYASLMGTVAAQSCARALQYGPTEGLALVKRCIVKVMAAEGLEIDADELLVTTGGQQVIDLVCKTLLDPGDVVVTEAPTYPGAVPTFSTYQADVVQVTMDRDGMRVGELESTLDQLDASGRRPKFIYTVPNFHNPAGVTMSLARRRELVRIAADRELLVLEDNPYGLLRYEGTPLPTLRSLDGGEFVIYASTFSKILSPGVRLGWTAAPAPVMAKMSIGKQASDLCSSSISQYFVGAYFDSGPWEEYVRSLIEIYRRRRDVMLDALAEQFPPEAEWTHPQGGLFVWATLPDYIDTTDLLARALEEHVAFVPGRAAYVDGRGGSSMRLNFSGVGEEEIREGVRRIGEIVREQVTLYGTLTGARPAAAQGAAGALRQHARRAAARARARARRRAGQDPADAGQAHASWMIQAGGRALSRVAVLKGGRSLERQVSLKSGARVEDALERLGHEVIPIDVGSDLVERLSAERPEIAFVALHGRDGEDGTVQELLEVLGIPYTGSGVSACMRAADKVLAKHAMRDRGIPTPDFYAFNETAFKELGAAQALPAIEERLEFPIVVKPARQGSALGIKFARTAADVPGALVAAFSYDRKVLLERHVTGRELAVSIIDEHGRSRALPIVEAVPEQEDFYDFEARYEIGRTRFVCPAELDEVLAERARTIAGEVYSLLGCSGFARVDLMLESASDQLYVLELNPIPGLTETSLLPQAADAAGIGFEELIERILSAVGPA